MKRSVRPWRWACSFLIFGTVDYIAGGKTSGLIGAAARQTLIHTSASPSPCRIITTPDSSVDILKYWYFLTREKSFRW